MSTLHRAHPRRYPARSVAAMLSADDGPPTLKAAFYGEAKRGKTHSSVALAVAAIRELGLPPKIVAACTELWHRDWRPRLAAIGITIVSIVDPRTKSVTADPAIVLATLREAIAEGYQIALLDSMTEILQHNRVLEQGRLGGKPIPGPAYARIDAPFNALVGFLKLTNLHWIATLREEDEKLTIDDEEKIVGKKGKAGKEFPFVPRLYCRCSLTHERGAGTHHVVDVTDCGTARGDHVISRLVDPKSEDWAPFLARYKEEK